MNRIFLSLAVAWGSTLCVFPQPTSWEETNGPFGGEVSWLDMDRNGNAYAEIHSTVYRSIDDCLTWHRIRLSHEQPWYFGSDGRIFSTIPPYQLPWNDTTRFHRILGSDSRLERWDTLTTSVSRRERFTLLGVDNNDRFYGNIDSILVRADHPSGDWISLGLKHIISISFDREGEIISASELGPLFRSTDDGLRWDTIPSPMQSYSAQPPRILSFEDGLLFTYGGQGPYFWRDSTSRWHGFAESGHGRAAGVIRAQDGTFVIFWDSAQGTSIYHTRHPTDSRILVTRVYTMARYTQILRSGAILVSTRSQMIRSADAGKTWVESSQGIQRMPITALHVARHLMLVGVGNTVYLSTDRGNSWTGSAIDGVDLDITAFDDDPSTGFIYAATSRYSYRSTDDGKTWTRMMVRYSTQTIAVHPNGTVYSGASMKTTDHGATWTYIGSAPSGLQHLAFRANGGLIGTAYHHEYTFRGRYTPATGRVYRTTLDDTTWERIAAFGNKPATSVVSDNENIMYIGTESSGIYRSTDGGESWSPIGLPVPVYSLAMDESGELYAGGAGRVYKITNDGTTWTTSKLGGDHRYATALAIDHEGFLLASLEFPRSFPWYERESAGLVRTSMRITSTDRIWSAEPLSAPRLSNFPNPFNASTLIQFFLEQQEEVLLEVYTMLGERVQTLVGGPMEKGWHHVDFSGSGLASGVYLYRLRTGMSMFTGKMLLAQ